VQKLGKLLEGIEHVQIAGDAGVEITNLEIDSRKTGPGSLFFALRGTVSDGHRFIDKAVSSGAVAVVCESLPDNRQNGVGYIKVKDTARALGYIASTFYGHPSRKLKLTGITGTNGKTTTATLLYRLFGEMGIKCGLVSTVAYYVGDRKLAATHTTPDPVTINRLLSEMVQEGCGHCFMEVSSHAVVQQRVSGLRFEGGIFSNITRDHLDYHNSFIEYMNAKKGFFDMLDKGSFALVNNDDRNSAYMVQNTGARVSTYAMKSMADFRAGIIESHPGGMLININGKELWTTFIGAFNAYNILAVYSAAMLLGSDEDEVLRLITSLEPVEGRFETIRSPEGVTAIVDYAHTPDALGNVIDTIRALLTPGKSLITVAGAGGDRDKGKRPLMAGIASEKSNRLILTSDNPRTEDPRSVIDDMMAGVSDEYRGKVLTMINREEAIRAACMMARPGDFVLIAGKGHETYQEIMGVKHHFDDREVVKTVFGSLDKIS
jgi:UDP-N-acetylmuramoyl-L-alanyl-D-glutamate--2,6-diaminopimelate ligase